MKSIWVQREPLVHKDRQTDADPITYKHYET